MNSLGPQKNRAAKLLETLNSEPMILTAEDGTQLMASYDRCAGQNSAVVILLQRWEGSTKSTCQVTTASIYSTMALTSYA
ncbi:MAG: hypothetical protein OSA42_05590 [Porticoccaceae bacterium]|nr:hypothetical protein [Porticoccaceae bacterium]